ncbi:MAG TPA: CPBP family intramembrane glutamic endopeptidase [Terriglobia bacterium]|nr:CPBP family intramembrane glutamic endopeptidase [Terriglobia bacterium]
MPACYCAQTVNETPEPLFPEPVNPSSDPQRETPDVYSTQMPAAPGLSTRHIAAAAGAGVVYLLMFILGGEFGAFAVTGLFAIPFVILAVLAYSAELKSRVARALTMIYWFVVNSATALVAILVTIAAIALPALGPITEFDPAAVQAASEKFPTLEQGLRILGAVLGLLIAGGISLACFLPAIRRKAAVLTNTDPHSFVHATALATVMAVTLMCLIPLVAVGEPPLLPMLQVDGGMALPPDDEQLRSTFYMLVWGFPAAFVAVGYPQRRTLREAQHRLGLERPTLRQLVFSAVMVGALLLVMPLLGHGIELLWKALGWPITDEEAIKQLFSFTAGPIAAFIASVVAGLGEEIVFRGVLQPRLGILLPALMFTSVHAFQYNFDALIQVFLLGVLFGLVRNRTNTTTSALIHFGYDFVLLTTTIE